MKDQTDTQRFKPLFVVLFVTTVCNLKCPYCYAGDLHEKQSMIWDVAEAALRLASRSGRPFHLQLTGGEPTLEPVLIERIVSWVRSRGLPATVALQTNGTHLNGWLVRFLDKQNIQLGVSIDGPPLVHERIRGGIERTLKGLALLSRVGVAFRTTTVVNQWNVSSLAQLALMLAGYPNCRGMALDLLVSKRRFVSGAEPKPCDPGSLAGGIRNLMETLARLNRTRRIPILLREHQRLASTEQSARTPDYCYACRGESMAVLPDGSVYPCSQTAGDPELYSGRIDRLEADRLQSLRQYRLQELAGEDCGSCAVEACCPGECPSRLRYNDQNAVTLACVLYRTLFSQPGGGRRNREKSSALQSTPAVVRAKLERPRRLLGTNGRPPQLERH